MQPTAEKRKYICRRCSREYNKAEHLARHEHSHTGEKPFACFSCKRQFTRLDSLTRHYQRTGHVRQATHSTQSNGPSDNNDLTWTEDEVAAANLFDPRVNFHIDSTNPPLVPEGDITNDVLFQLTWPDSEDLLQSILNSSSDPVAASAEVQPLDLSFTIDPKEKRDALSLWSPQIITGRSAEGHTAVKDVSQIIANLSTDVTTEASLTSLSTTFLDECLHLFFDRFIPIFPVCHRPTFEYRQWTHPLLLNAIAIGSLFLGQDQHVAQGEALWKLAHVAVATSWHSFIQHQAQSDSRRGVQLVATALLGQTYAMLSRNPKLRMTAQMFHSLGFYWASECGLYMTQRIFDSSKVPGASGDSLHQYWRTWVGEEVQLRVLLGHYILDSQVAEFLNAPTSQRHTSNSLPLPCSERLFSATTANEWADLLRSESHKTLTFRELFLDLYTNSPARAQLPPALSPLALKVVIEGLRSIILETKSAGGPVLGTPSLEETTRAMGLLYSYMAQADHISSGHQTEVLLRWHTVCIDMCTDTGRVCRDLCAIKNIDQDVFADRTDREKTTSFSGWVLDPKVRVALLHASAIYEQLDHLALSHAHAVHLPMSVFCAAVTYCGFISAGVSTISLPKNLNWIDVVDLSSTLCSRGPSNQLSPELRNSKLGTFVFDMSEPRSAARRNLLYEMNVFLLRLRQMSQPWGIATSLERILRSLLSSIVADKTQP